MRPILQASSQQSSQQSWQRFLLKISVFLGCMIPWATVGVLAAQAQTLPTSAKISQSNSLVNSTSDPTSGSMPGLKVPEAKAPEAKAPEAKTTEAKATKTAIAPILSPVANAILDNPATSIVVQYPEGQNFVLQVNGKPVPSNQIGRTEVDNQTKRVTQTFYGVALQDGKNQIQTLIDNVVVSNIEVQVRGVATAIKIKPEMPTVPADGRSTVTIQGQLLDDQGNRSNRDAWVTLASEAGEWVGADGDPDQAGFQVKALQGQFKAILRSGLEAKPVTIRAIAGKTETFTQVQFTTNLRSSIATGVISIRLGNRGTDYYNRRRDFLPLDQDNHLKLSAKGSLFVMGSVGEWLITGAYNSDRALNETCDGGNRLFRDLQACENHYPVYGDSSSSTILAPSTDNVFFRIERTSPVANAGTDYAQWGDYRTEEFARTSQQFTATQRSLHGAKLNYNLGDLQVTGFYGNNVEGFQRDTIAPDGTSGYYFLSRRLLVEGSENVFLELEELDRPGTVLDRKNLSRGQDYDIDYDRGSLFFRQPVLRTDVSRTGEILVRRIVVTYQYDEPGSNNHIFGGRLQYNLFRNQGRESWLGATYIKEKQGNRNFELYGADAYISLGDRGRLIAEYAHSQNDSEFLGPVSGSAYRIEVDGQIAKGIQGRAYYRSTETGFANNATTSFVPGQTRYGAQVSAAVSSTTNLRVQYDHEDNRGIAPRPLTTLSDLLTPRQEALPGSKVDNSLTTISFGVQQRLGQADLSVDWLHRTRTDRLAPNALSSTSDQLRSRFSLPITSRLTFQAQNETTLSSQVDAVYSDRTLLGLDWQAMPGVNVQLAQQFYHRGPLAGQSYTSFNVTGDYNLGPDTKITGRYSLIGGANELTMQGAIGFNQKFRLSPGLKMDLSYEHIFSTFSRTGAGQRFAQPYIFGQAASALGLDGGDNFSLGIEYTDSPNFNASARIDHRTSSTGRNTVISASANGKLSPSLTAMLRYQQANAANQTITGLGDSKTLRMGLAYRDPSDDKFNALLRYEYRKNPSTTPETILFGSGTGSEEHLFAFEGLYAPSWQWEFYGKFGIRSSKTYLAEDLVGTSTITLAQARATYRLGYRWDLTGEARWIGQPAAGFSESALLAELGYYLTPNLRVAAGYSFGRVSDRDLDGSRSAGGPYLGLTVKINELFNGFGLQKVAPPQQQESEKSTLVQASPAKSATSNLPTASQ
jgi:hypothetical protein